METGGGGILMDPQLLKESNLFSIQILISKCEQSYESSNATAIKDSCKQFNWKLDNEAHSNLHVLENIINITLTEPW
jgi:hypothetical protein